MAVLQGLTEFPACTIAAIDGPALGAGAQLAVACDLRVATEASVIGIPAARLGIVIDVWTVRRLVALAGGATARAMLLTAHAVSGSEAHRLGLVQRVGDLRGHAEVGRRDLPAARRSASPVTRLPSSSSTTPPTCSAAREAAWESADIAEGRAAFLEKRASRLHRQVALVGGSAAEVEHGARVAGHEAAALVAEVGRRSET